MCTHQTGASGPRIGAGALYALLKWPQTERMTVRLVYTPEAGKVGNHVYHRTRRGRAWC